MPGRLPPVPQAPPPAERVPSDAAPDPYVESPPLEEGIDWRRYLAAAWRYKWLILLVTALGSGLGGLAVKWLVAPQYEAKATIWIESISRQEAERGPIRSSELLRAQAWEELLRSYVVLDPVVREMRLYLRALSAADSTALAGFGLGERFLPGRYRLAIDPGGEAFGLFDASGRLMQRGSAGDSVGQQLGFLWAPSSELLGADRTIEFSVDNPRDVANRLAKELESRMDLSGNFLRLALTGDDPQRVAAVLNAVADRYVEVAGELKSAKLRELTNILDEQLDYAAEDLRRAEAALEGHRVRTITLPSEPATPIVPGLAATRDPAFANYFDLKVEREQLRRDREAVERPLMQAPDSGLSVEALEVVPAVRGSSDLAAALSELTGKRAELRALRYTYTDEYPPVRELAAEVETLARSTIPSLAAALVGELSAREQELERLIGSASGELGQVPPRAIEEARLERRVEIATNLYTTLRERYEAQRLAAASSMPDVRVLDPAIPPRRPTNEKDRPRYMLLAFLASLGMAVTGALLLDRLDYRLRYPQQVTHALGLPILGTVPHVEGQSGPAAASSHQVVESFRMIRLNVLHAYGSAGPLVVAVTSPASEEGKSFVTANLALAFGTLGHRTLVIDGDVRRGRLHRFLGGTRKPGLTDYLAGTATIERIVQRTLNGSLHRIGCGSRRQDGPELLHSATMATLFSQLRSRYDVVLVDTPPLAAGADPFIFGTLTGNLLLVLRTGSTNRELAEAKLDVLDHFPIRVLGAVLNDVPAKGRYSYYSHYSYLPAYQVFDEESPAEVGSRLRHVSDAAVAEANQPEPESGSGDNGLHGQEENPAPDEAQSQLPGLTLESNPRPQPRSAGNPGRPPPQSNPHGKPRAAGNPGHSPPQSNRGARSETGSKNAPPESENPEFEVYREHQRRNQVRYWR
jgi:succinoglycan biosynthesis transport protein ExoP